MLQEKNKLAQRGLLEVLAMVSKLSALTFIEIAYVASLQKMSILLSIIGGGIIYKEQQIKKRLFAACIMLVGAGMIIWSKFS